VVTFADGVLRLVRSGARIELRHEHPVHAQTDDLAADLAGAMLLAAEALPLESSAAPAADDSGNEWASYEASANLVATEPGLADLEAAVAMVEAGVATRIVLAGFPSWPGLLWRAYQLADATNVVILPTVVRPGGLVDIVITRDSAADV
jgi:hypothetical protein